MRKIRSVAVKEQKNNNYVKILIVTATVIILAVIGLILAEYFLKCRISIVNNTDKNIESVRVYFDDDGSTQTTADLINVRIDSGKKISGQFEKLDMKSVEMYMIFEVKFEDEEELYMYDGFFSGVYEGRVNIEFYQSDGDYFMHAAAGTGLFNDTDVTDVDTDFILKFDEKDWDYYYG